MKYKTNQDEIHIHNGVRKEDEKDCNTNPKVKEKYSTKKSKIIPTKKNIKVEITTFKKIKSSKIKLPEQCYFSQKYN